MLVSAIHQHESAIGIHMSPPSWTSVPPPTPFHPSRLSQSTENNHIQFNFLFNIMVCTFLSSLINLCLSESKKYLLMFSLLYFTVFLFLFFFFWFNFKIFLVMQHSLWDLSSPIRNWTRPSTLEAWSSNHWTAKEFPVLNFIFRLVIHFELFLLSFFFFFFPFLYGISMGLQRLRHKWTTFTHSHPIKRTVSSILAEGLSFIY